MNEEENNEKIDLQERMSRLGKIARGAKKRRDAEHYEKISKLATEGRKKAAKADPSWHSRRMARAWETRRNRGT